jgi:outer membrane immunogenic protein
MLRKLLALVGVSSVLAAAPLAAAYAADMPLKAPPPPAAFSWAGWYIGGNIGGGWGRAGSDTVTFAPSAAGSIPGGASLALPGMSASTLLGGAQIGYNWQRGPIVYGLEADIDGQKWNAAQSLTAFAPGLGTLFVPGDAFSVQSQWQGAFLGRVGYAWDRTLLYVTGGLAVTNVKVSSSFVVFGLDPATAGSGSKTLAGATFGGGIEHALSSKWSVGLEGRYAWYGASTYSTGTVALGAPPIFDPVTQSVHVNTGLVVGKVNYHF